MLHHLTSYLVLPKQISGFERTYLARMNRIALLFFYAHVPVFMAVAAVCKTGVLLAAVLTTLTVVGPTLAYAGFRNPRNVSAVFGLTAMCMGGLLVHFGQGPMQIEMHFYFFVLLALLSVFANPMVIVLAAVTVALHHGLLFALLPRSVFNYEASAWAVVVHAGFVVLESIAACFVARSFFDNVIGLERIVAERTHDVDVLNRDLQLVLDNVGQGFVTLDRDGQMSRERSAVVATWFGDAAPGARLADYLRACDDEFAAMFDVSWQEIFADVMPLEVVLSQLPARLASEQRIIDVAYRPILSAGVLDKVLVIMTDVTSAVQQARVEAEQREILDIMGHISKDRSGFLAYLREGESIVDRLTSSEASEPVEIRRLVHTLKGNSALYAVSSVSAACHELEEAMVDREGGLEEREKTALRARWRQLEGKVDLLIGTRAHTAIEVARPEYDTALTALLGDAPREDVAQMMAGWQLEPTARRLEQVAAQTRGIARRLGRGEIDVDISHNDEKLLARDWTPFWSAFTHVVRNAADHGLEMPAERLVAGKPPRGRIELRTYSTPQSFFVEIADDGRGVDWTTLAARARVAGLPFATQDDLVEAMFGDGVSTRATVTEVSGRGVGLAAVRAACRALHGDILVVSEEGRGTRLRFCFPLRSTGRQMVSGTVATLGGNVHGIALPSRPPPAAVGRIGSA